MSNTSSNTSNFQRPAKLELSKIVELLHGPICQELIRILGKLGIDSPQTLANHILEQSSHLDSAQYERQCYRSLREHPILERNISKALSERAKKQVCDIESYLNSGSVLDLGCGDGQVGLLLETQGFAVTFADVYPHRNIAERVQLLPRESMASAPPISVGHFDNVLLLAVLHHSEDEVQLLDFATRSLKRDGMMIVIESVYGVEPEEHCPYRMLSAEGQFYFNCFFDYFYNRCIHYSEDSATKVPVPFNFRPPREWNALFEAFGLSVIETKYLGQDIDVVPEFHTIHVLQKR